MGIYSVEDNKFVIEGTLKNHICAVLEANIPSVHVRSVKGYTSISVIAYRTTLGKSIYNKTAQRKMLKIILKPVRRPQGSSHGRILKNQVFL